MHALRQEIIPASGIEYFTSLKLLPSSVSPSSTTEGSSPGRHDYMKKPAICNLVVARSNVLRIFEMRDDPPESVDGRTRPRLHFIRQHRLHGLVTGLASVRVVAGVQDGLDRLLVSFKDAKIALLEWSQAAHDVVTVSIHTYERAPPLLLHDPTRPFRARLRVDPLSRCAALQLPADGVAILPFLQSAADDIGMGIDIAPSPSAAIPYSPSFILSLTTTIDPAFHTLLDLLFLPGLNSPTVALLFSTLPTCTGRLAEHRDSTKLVIFTLNPLSRACAVIASVPGLPYDAFALVAPREGGRGGVLVVGANELVFVEQTGRKVGLAVNGWVARGVTEMAMPAVQGSSPDGTRELQLEGSRAVFVDDKTVYIILRSGHVYPLEIVAEGRTVGRLVLGERPLARVGVPECVGRVGERMVFVGSTTGPSVLVGLNQVQVEEEEQGEGEGEGMVLDTTDKTTTTMDDLDMDLYGDDADLYGLSPTPVHPPTSTTDANGPSTTEKKRRMRVRTETQLTLYDSLPAHGNITDMTMSFTRNGPSSSSGFDYANNNNNNKSPEPELILSTGQGHTGGFTLLQRDLPSWTKRKIHAIGGARGVWALNIRKDSASSSNRDTLILSTDATPSPGLSRIATLRSTTKNELTITTRIPGTTVGCAPFFSSTAILHILTHSIRVLEPDGSERQVIKDVDSTSASAANNHNNSPTPAPRAKIVRWSVSDPYVWVGREDGTIGMFVASERGRIRRKDMSPMGGKGSRYLAGCFWRDESGVIGVREKGKGAGGEEEKEKTTTTTQTQWLVLVRPQGVLEIWSLPKLAIVFSTNGIARLHGVVCDSYAKEGISSQGQESNATTAHQPQQAKKGDDIDQVLIAPLGETFSIPHLFVFLRSGHLAVYAILPTVSQHHDGDGDGEGEGDGEVGERTMGLGIRMVKVLSRVHDVGAFGTTTTTMGGEDVDMGTPTPVMTPTPTAAGPLAEFKKISRLFIPFSTAPPSSSPRAERSRTLNGVFFTGDHPTWFVCTDKGGIQAYPSGHNIVHAFSACSLWNDDDSSSSKSSSSSEFLMYTEEGPCLVEWIEDLQLDMPLPARCVPRGRAYSNLFFDTGTGLVVAASSLHARFASYNEESQRIWEPDAPNISDPVCHCSTLELISLSGAGGAGMTMDGYEFAGNEYVNALECVVLETASTEVGKKEFIAVGTTIDRGEDLAVKGATYIFEIVEVVPDPNLHQKRWYKLRLRCRDEAKGPVTAVSGFNGYLVSSMGQKIFVRAFDGDERLVGVAFLDVGVYVTTLRTLKNLLLVGDVVKSVWLVGFQEDPYRLLVLGKDVQPVSVSCADFFFAGDELAFVTCDEEGVLRLYEYDPADPDSKGGQHLMLRTEFHTQVEYTASCLLANRLAPDQLLPQSRLLCGSTDGTLSTLTPLPDALSKRLHLLSGHLTRNLQHTAALNPRAMRAVVNQSHSSKSLSRGVVDGNLVMQFVEGMGWGRQDEMCRQIGLERGVVCADWVRVGGPERVW